MYLPESCTSQTLSYVYGCSRQTSRQFLAAFADTISACGYHEEKHLLFLHIAALFFHNSMECGGKCACP